MSLILQPGHCVVIARRSHLLNLYPSDEQQPRFGNEHDRVPEAKKLTKLGKMNEDSVDSSDVLMGQ